jgi:O-antigen/teichoic acid export membrane protein
VDYGILEILDLSMSLLGMFLNMGITAALLRCYAAATTDEDRRKTISSAFLFVIVTGALTFLAALAFVRPVSALLVGPEAPPKYLVIALSAFVLGYIANLPRSYLRALEASGTFVAVETGSLLLVLGLNILFIAVLRIGLIGILLSSLIVAGLQVPLHSAWMIRKTGFGLNTVLLKKMLAFGAPLMFSNLAVFILNFADRFFLQQLRSLDVVGVYAVGYKFGYMLNYLLVQPFFVMWQSRMFIIHSRPDHPQIFARIFLLYSGLLTYAGLAISLLSPEIVRLMVGPGFAESRHVIPLVVGAYIFYGMGLFTELGLFLTDKTSMIGMIGAGSAVLNLVLNYVLILRYGMIGAAWATLLSFAVMTCASYVASRRVFPLPLPVGRASLMIAVAGCIFGLGRLLDFDSPRVLIAIKLALLACFPVVLWALRAFVITDLTALFPADKGFLGALLARFAGPPPVEEKQRSMARNVIVLTSGLTGSSVLTGLVARAGYWTGTTHRKEDYDTYENQGLIELNRQLFEAAGYTGNYMTEFSPVLLDKIESLHGVVDGERYRLFVAQCKEHGPWVWKDPRLWITIRFWKRYLDFENCRFLLLTRGYMQCWVSGTLRRQIRSYKDSRQYEESVQNAIREFLVDSGADFMQLSYEDLVVAPELTIARLNGFLGTTLSVAGLRSVYHKPLYRTPRGSIRDYVKAVLIYLRNYSHRVDAVRAAGR